VRVFLGLLLMLEFFLQYLYNNLIIKMLLRDISVKPTSVCFEFDIYPARKVDQFGYSPSWVDETTFEFFEAINLLIFSGTFFGVGYFVVTRGFQLLDYCIR